MPKKLEKLSLDEFLKLKQEVFDFLSWMDETDENLSGKYDEKNAKTLEKEESSDQEQIEKLKVEIALLKEEINKIGNEWENKAIGFIKNRYTEIIKILSSHDLSEIDYNQWEGFAIINYEELGIIIDFSNTKANLDFSKIRFEGEENKTNFKNCKIINFPFEEVYYDEKVFDDDFIKSKEEYFLLDKNIPQDIKQKFYEGKLKATEIFSYEEIKEKFNKKNLEWEYRQIFENLGKEEFLKLGLRKFELLEDFHLVFLVSEADEIKKEIYDRIKRVILYPGKASLPEFINEETGEYESLTKEEIQMLIQKYKDILIEQMPELFLDDSVWPNLQKAYYSQTLKLEDYYNNIKYFKNKIVFHAILERSKLEYQDSIIEYLRRRFRKNL